MMKVGPKSVPESIEPGNDSRATIRSILAEKSPKEDHKKSLDRAYGLVVAELLKTPGDRDLLLLLGDILMKFGRLRYEESYPTCMVLMRASFNAKLVALGMFDRMFGQYETLSKLEEALFRHEDFEPLNEYLLNSDPKAVAETIQSKNCTPEDLMALGYTLSWMANGLINTDGFKENHRLLDQVYALSEKLLQASGTESAKLELAELYYNGFCGTELRNDPKNPENVGRAHQWLARAAELNPSLEMKARVANLKCCHWYGAGDFEKAQGLCAEAIQIRQSFPKEEQNPFLVANLHNQHALFLLLGNRIEEADAAINRALEHSTACRGKRDPETDRLVDPINNQQYFGIYDLNKAKILLAKGDSHEAMKWADRALETFEQHRQSSESATAKALALKEEIFKGHH